MFDEPFTFTDGASHARLEVVIDPRRPRAVRLRPPGGYGLYRISNLDARSFRIELTALCGAAPLSIGTDGQRGPPG